MGKDVVKGHRDILEDLKEDYKNGLVSALVGAGFSKNVSDSFFDWKELLYDMVGELYAIDIDNYLKNTSEINRDETKDEYIKSVLKKENSLDLVSKYIKYKGYRECVEFYIEGKIRYVDHNSGNKIVLKLREAEKEVVDEKCFSAHKALLEADRLQTIYTTNYDNLLEFAVELLSPSVQDLPQTILDAKDLSDKIQNRKIIKIHGNLRRNHNEKIEFDGDNKLCYIIAKEDYETYQKKHETFTSLMRMAMLQGKFMLLGFSGTDTNYQNWLTWMCDMLNDVNDNTKIYIIDVSGKQVSPDLQLHFDKHRTKVLNLIDKDRLNAIGFEDSNIMAIFQQYEKENKLENSVKRERY